MSKIEVPKIAAKLIEDAKAAGMEVVVNHDSVSLHVHVENGDRSVGVMWAVTTVYDSPLRNERLGFRTSGGKSAVRFSYAEGRDYRGWQSPRSVRQARAIVGLEI